MLGARLAFEADWAESVILFTADASIDECSFVFGTIGTFRVGTRRTFYDHMIVFEDLATSLIFHWLVKVLRLAGRTSSILITIDASLRARNHFITRHIKRIAVLK